MNTSTKPETSSDFTLSLTESAAKRVREIIEQNDLPATAVTSDPDCPVCGANPTVTELIDYDAFCGIGAEPPDAGPEVTARDLAREMDGNAGLVLIDVREHIEWEICRIPGAILIPLGALPERLGEIDGHHDIVTHCHTGVRSMQALEILRAAGFGRVRSLQGGIEAWSNDVDRDVARY